MRIPTWARLDLPLPRFLAVGVTNTLISFGVFMGMLQILGGVPQRAAIAQATGYAVAIAWSFTWNRRWTFGVGGPWAGRFARFLALQLALLALSAGALHLAVDRAKIPAVPAWISVMAVVTLLNYFGQRRLVFGRAESGNIAAPSTADLLAGIAIVLTAAGFGLSYGVDDQNTYLLHGLMRMRPSAIPGDWLAHETLLYHGTWAWSLLVTTCLAWKPA
jgi:putative flippase GtrA